jgi:hypothetical protein
MTTIIDTALKVAVIGIIAYVLIWGVAELVQDFITWVN